MDIRLDYSNMMADVVGEAHGIGEGELDALRGRTSEIHRELMQRRKSGDLPFYDLPFATREVEEIGRLADDLAERFDNLVVLGIGGSALGTLAIFRALAETQHNLLEREARGGRPRLFVLDNVDPWTFAGTMDFLDPQRTGFCVISKSGSTVETSCQFLIARQWAAERLGADWKKHFVLVTDPRQGLLRRLADAEDFLSCEIPPGVGGRFSVFSSVGLLPLATVGVDVREVLRGAAEMCGRVTRESLMDNPAYLNAALQYLAYRKGKTISVMMPYSDRLRDVADWYRQLWAESLGKKSGLNGELVHVGPTPVKALGTTDQHSQVQLYMEGPFDKVVTFIVPEDYGQELIIPKWDAAPDLGYLDGKSMAELIHSEQRGTAMALSRNGRPNCCLSLPAVTPAYVGALLYLLEVQTVFAGGLFGIDPLDQPGVEEGKELTYGLMGRSGFEGKRKEIESWEQTVNRRII